MPEDGLGRTSPRWQQDGISPSAPWGNLPGPVSYMGPQVRETKGYEEIQKKKKKAEDPSGPGLISSSGHVSSSGFAPRPVGTDKEVFCPMEQESMLAGRCPARLIYFTAKAHNDADESY